MVVGEYVLYGWSNRLRTKRERVWAYCMGMYPPSFRLHVECAMVQKARAATAAGVIGAGQGAPCDKKNEI